EICGRLAEKGFASTNMIYGIGSFSYQYNTRDTFGFALKSTYAIINGEEKLIYKDPKTDDGTKRSQRGLVHVHYDEAGEITYKDGLSENDYSMTDKTDLLDVIFEDGMLVRDQSLSEIRSILHEKL